MEKVIITLTGRPRPVEIDEDEWPILAQAEWEEGEKKLERRVWQLIVRQHEDGRALVYGVFETHRRGEHPRRGGELVPPGGDIPETVHRVAESLGFDPWLAEETIGDLPPEEL